MRPIDRLLKYLDYIELLPARLERTVDISNGYISKSYERKGTIGSEILDKIHRQYPELNVSWVLTGQGQMLVPVTGNTPSPNPKESGSDNEKRGLPGAAKGHNYPEKLHPTLHATYENDSINAVLEEYQEDYNKGRGKNRSNPLFSGDYGGKIPFFIANFPLSSNLIKKGATLPQPNVLIDIPIYANVYAGCIAYPLHDDTLEGDHGIEKESIIFVKEVPHWKKHLQVQKLYEIRLLDGRRLYYRIDKIGAKKDLLLVPLNLIHKPETLPAILVESVWKIYGFIPPPLP